MTTTNYPPGVTGVPTATVIECTCSLGHRWEAPAWSELGSTTFADEEHGWYCPSPGCGHPIDDYADTSFGEPSSGYVHCSDGVWRIPLDDGPEDEHSSIAADVDQFESQVLRSVLTLALGDFANDTDRLDAVVATLTEHLHEVEYSIVLAKRLRSLADE